jgi:TolB-like protein/Tfp pilus assembly protein PilF
MENEPPPLARYSDVPAEFERIVSKTLQKSKDERYQSADDLLLDLKDLKQQREVTRLKRSLQVDASSKETTTPVDWQTGHTFHASAVHTAGYLVNKSKRHKRGGALVAVAVVIAFLASAYFYSTGNRYSGVGEAIDSVAVLPFVNVSGDPNTEYLSDGLSDSIINSLSRLPTLRVMSFNSVLRYKGKQADPQAVGRELNVRAVLMTRLVHQGDNLAISTELVSVRDNRRLWGEQYSLKVSDILAIQDEIAREISEKLGLRLGQEKKGLAKRYTESSEAYQLSLLGQYHLRKLSKEGFAKGLEYFEQAINKDPAYAPAYVGVANIYHNLGIRGLMSPNEAQQKAEQATRRALLLDDTLAEAHVSLGSIKEYAWDWPAAEKEFKRALELSPGSVQANSAYRGYLDDIGRPNEALAWANRAYEMDGLSPVSLASLGAAYDHASQYDQAIDRFLKAIELDANYAPAYARLGHAYIKKGAYEDAIRVLEKAKSLEDSPARKGRFAWLAFAYAASGRTDQARKMLDELKGIANEHYIAPDNFALIYIGLDNKDQAFAFLEKAYAEHSQMMTTLKSESLFDSLRSDSRFTDLMRRVGLTP